MRRVSILHVSDLHRDMSDEIENEVLLDSVERDIRRQVDEGQLRQLPDICVVSGDLIFGVHPTRPDADAEIERQYVQALKLLRGISDRLFGGSRDRLVLLPGNHDISYPVASRAMVRVEIPENAADKKRLVAELFRPGTRLRWSWNELCLYRIADENGYLKRLDAFAATYREFYDSRRVYASTPEQQYEVFDFPELQLSILALCSCVDNDPLGTSAKINPVALTQGCQELCRPERLGWTLAATWHHSFRGGPLQSDYLDDEFLQYLIDVGVTVGLHGHHHQPDYIEERFRSGASGGSIAVFSAGTLCSGPAELVPGRPRNFNVIEIDEDRTKGRLHSREMMNRDFTLPIWGPGRFAVTNASFLDFRLSARGAGRPPRLDEQLQLSRAESLIGRRDWIGARDELATIRLNPMARVMLVRVLEELDDPHAVLDLLWPPQTAAEMVVLGGALLEMDSDCARADFLALEQVSTSSDASVKELVRRLSLKGSA